MDWILNHIWIVVVIAGLVGKAVQAIRGNPPASGKGAAAPEGKGFDDPELAERTRKIREEIRRKIEERREQSGPPPGPDPARPRLGAGDRSPEATPPPTFFELPAPVRQVFPPAAVPEPPPLLEDMAGAVAELGRQRELDERLRQIVARKAGDERQAAFEDSIADKEQAARVTSRAALLDDLHDPAALRRAFVLREVLGPPVALRY